MHLDVTQFGLDPGATFAVPDLITGAELDWGADNYVRLDAFTEPVHILRRPSTTATSATRRTQNASAD